MGAAVSTIRRRHVGRAGISFLLHPVSRTTKGARKKRDKIKEWFKERISPGDELTHDRLVIGNAA